MDARRRADLAEEAASAGARMVEAARASVVEIRSGGRGSGAGVIWSEDGLVLTNDHVLGGRRGTVGMTLADGRTFDAEVVRRTRSLDLALLRLRGARSLPAATPGDSDALRVGGLVFAIGHPWGRPGTVTAGVVSGLGVPRRAGRGGRGAAGRYIESDVALAPGNSGGPLLDAGGRVVGINAMIFGRTALSIPANAAGAWVAEGGADDGRPRLGVGVVPVEIPATQRPAEGDGSGLVVSAVEEGGPGDRAGLLVGDVLLGVAGLPPQDIGSFPDSLPAGDAVSLRVMRGPKTLVVEVPPRAPGRAA